MLRHFRHASSSAAAIVSPPPLFFAERHLAFVLRHCRRRCICRHHFANISTLISPRHAAATIVSIAADYFAAITAQRFCRLRLFSPPIFRFCLRHASRQRWPAISLPLHTLSSLRFS
jgi:hypothetical protein